MKPPPLAQFLNLVFLFVILSLTSLSLTSCGGDRRILHQPLFPVESTPPPEPPPPPPPPPLDIPDEPFFPETPTNGITQPQTQSPPNNNISTSNPVPIATQPSTTQTKKVAIAISVGIVTLGMLSALAFFLYRHRANHPPTESQKLVGNEGGAQNAPTTTTNNNNNPTNSDILYLGTMEPSNPVTVSEENGSPYHKLVSITSSERYRPSPELQPLPPLSRPPFSKTSPSVMSSEDAFYSPQCSTTSNGEGSYSPVPKHMFADSGTSVTKSLVTHSNTSNSNPHSRRSSPKSRLSFSSPPDVKQVIVPPPSSPQTPTPPPPPQPLPPKSARIPTPPPPPPPPRPTLVEARKQVGWKTSVPPMPIQLIPRSQTNTCIPKATVGAELKEPVVETTRGGSSSEPPRNEVDQVDGTKPKLKPLHWDKVRATSDRAMVWDQFKSNSFHLNEDMIETLFGCNSQNQAKKESSRRSLLPPMEQENRVLDPKKSQNIAILLRALNVTRDEVSEALLDGNPDGLGAELLETLVKMAPTKEEELKLRDYNGDVAKLGSAERFLKAVLDIPFAFRRVDAMLYRANFDTEVKYLRKSFDTLEAACEELKNSRLFLKLLEAVLRTGNRMNVGTNRGDARAFKLDTLLKLVDIKGVDGKTTLLHFVVQEMIRSEGAGTDNTSEDHPNNLHQNVKEGDIQKQGLRVVAGLGRELGNVKKAAGMDSDVLRSYLSKLEMGLEKVRLVLQYEKSNTKGKFFEAMHLFLDEAEKEIISIKTDEKKSLFHVKEVTAYFHGDTAKEEAHPFRIFMVVRDFLGVLDQVCKEVGKMHERTVVGSARSFRISSSASLPVLNRYNIRHEANSDEDSSSP